jgi:RimJ/RimL family protein N-acetyltransferase
MTSVHLRPTTPNDLDFVVAAEQNPDSLPFIVPWPRERHAASLVDPDIAHSILVHDALGPVGFVILAGLTNANDSLEFRRLVVTVKGSGIGRAAVRLVKEFAFAQRRVHRLWLDVKEQNHRARSLYASEGFAVESLLRECLKGDHGFDSLVVMSMLSSEYREGGCDAKGA